jgi:hypothetical protein
MLPKLAESERPSIWSRAGAARIFRAPNGKKAHVSVFGGALAVYSGGVVKLACDRRGFTFAGACDGNQFLACDMAVDVVLESDAGGENGQALRPVQ